MIKKYMARHASYDKQVVEKKLRSDTFRARVKNPNTYRNHFVLDERLE